MLHMYTTIGKRVCAPPIKKKKNRRNLTVGLANRNETL